MHIYGIKIDAHNVLTIFKKATFIFLPLFIFSLAMLLLLYLIELEKQETLAGNYAYRHLHTLKGIIVNELVMVISDLLLLAEESVDGLEHSNDEPFKARKIKHYQDFLKNRVIYDKIHLINLTRQEILQIGFNATRAQVFSTFEPWTEKNSHHFGEIMRLSKETIYIAPFDFNQEQAHLFIQIGKTIFNPQGKKIGGIVLDYLGKRILSVFDEILIDDPGDTMLLNEEGYFLKGPYRLDEWGVVFQEPQKRKFQHRFAPAWQKISTQDSGQFTHSNGLFTFITISPELIQQVLAFPDKTLQVSFDHHWKIVSHISMEALQTISRNFLEKLTVIIFSFTVLIASGSLVLSFINYRRVLAEQHLKEQFVSYARFVPQEFLILLNRRNFSDIEVSDYIQKEVTLFFSDVRSYTHLSETMSPRETFDFLNIYFAQLDPLIKKNRGFIDKFIGDAVMAIFPESPQDALFSVIEIKRQLEHYNKSRKEAGLEPIRIGVGIHCGEVSLGTVGTPRRMQTTVIGDVVNLASRIESLTKVFKIDIILSGSVYKALPHPHNFHLREIDTVRVKGKQQAVVLYEVFDVNLPEVIEQKKQSLPLFQEALHCYKNRHFEEAMILFKRCQEICPQDSIPPVYIKRCSTLQRVPPGADWSGVSTL